MLQNKVGASVPILPSGCRPALTLDSLAFRRSPTQHCEMSAETDETLTRLRRFLNSSLVTMRTLPAAFCNRPSQPPQSDSAAGRFCALPFRSVILTPSQMLRCIAQCRASSPASSTQMQSADRQAYVTYGSLIFSDHTCCAMRRTSKKYLYSEIDIATSNN